MKITDLEDVVEGLVSSSKALVDFSTHDDLVVFDDHFESVVLEIPNSVFNTSKIIIIGVIYRPPRTDNRCLILQSDII